MSPALYAIPTPLGGPVVEALPAPSLALVAGIADFVVENAKPARAFLKEVGLAPRELRLHELRANEDFDRLLSPLREGRPLGLLSEAGAPAIADPGAGLVEAAHRAGFKVVPLIGPSSIALALMASGLQGQRFAFCGYLPREKPERERRLRELEKRSLREDETEIFIETPYRNEAMLESLISICQAQTRVCVAADLTLATETVRTMSVQAWRMARPLLGKRPAVFLLHAGTR